MDEKKKLVVFWVILALLLILGLALASQVGHLSLKKELSAGDVAKLLTTYFVLALLVERTLEVFITAWRGKKTVEGEGMVQLAELKRTQNPTDVGLQDTAVARSNWLAEYKTETQSIALRSGLVLGILIAAVGVRSFDTFVEGPAINPTELWPQIQLGAFRVLDVLVSGGIIGGGSDAIHKMMNVITGFFDATAKKVKQ